MSSKKPKIQSTNTLANSAERDWAAYNNIKPPAGYKPFWNSTDKVDEVVIEYAPGSGRQTKGLGE